MEEERIAEDQIKIQLENFIDDAEVIDKTELNAVLKSIKENWTHLTQTEKKNFVQLFIKQIDVKTEDRNTLSIKHIDFY